MSWMEIDVHKISYKMIAHNQGLERQQQIWVCPLEWETKSSTTQFKAFLCPSHSKGIHSVGW
jgi:hypothetical protein